MEHKAGTFQAATLVVIGSGAAGLVAALAAAKGGADVILVEAGDLLGGATALSEGMAWFPNNPEARQLPDAPSMSEEAESALAYLEACSGFGFDAARARAYIDAGPQVLAFLKEEAGLEFRLNRGSRDYYPDAPGSSLGRRALNPLPFDARGMDPTFFSHIRPPLGTMVLFGGMSIASQDLADYMNVMRSPAAMVRITGHIARYVLDRMQGWSRGTRVANGNAIVARLTAAADAAGVRILTGWPAEEMFCDVAGKVCGIAGPKGSILASGGVILASGGLNAHPTGRRELVGDFSHIPLPEAEPGLPGLSGLIAGTGAVLVRPSREPLLWAPASEVPATVHRAGRWPHFGDRAKPGTICVGPDGRRFANEAQVYHDFVPAMIRAFRHYPEGPHCWIICDHHAIRRYGLGPVGPAPVRLEPYLRAGYLHRGSSVAELASRIGIPGAVLNETIGRFNEAARQGQDPDFGRGESVYDQGNGDPENRPNPALRPLARGPFYAIRLLPGDIGGFIGLATDAKARALSASGRPVPGLWAAGNAAAPLTDGTYPAAGLTIGAALTFGYIAARDALARLRGSRHLENQMRGG